MIDEVQQLRMQLADHGEIITRQEAEIERLRAQTVTDWIKHGDEIERLRAALEPFARNIDAVSLSATLGHITREHLREARRALEPKP